VGNKASRDLITPEPFWFLNPQLSCLAVLERRFVAQWTHDDKAAEDWLQRELVAGRLPWHAGVEIEYFDVRTAGPITLPGTVLRWFWQTRHCTPINWKTSGTVYVGPSILTGEGPDGIKYPITDDRSRIRIELVLIRFYHPAVVRGLCLDGLMPWPEEPPAEPPREGVKADGTEPQDTLSVRRAIEAFGVRIYGSKWKRVKHSVFVEAARKDKEFNEVVKPFPHDSTFRRTRGRKK
jgi:hypothetical protein